VPKIHFSIFNSFDHVSIDLAVGLMLLAMVCGVMSVVLQYQWELRVAQKIKALGGQCRMGLLWTRLGSRIDARKNSCMRTHWQNPPGLLRDPSDLLSQILACHGLRDLYLFDPQITDADLVRLNRLTNLQSLYLELSPHQPRTPC